ncbi:hypothetical protein PN498_09190 [Oscillatoria sp. CS-180]|uniref:TubC N-terminal docking domain-related protein n=1 Tax=Oscillatoria sp. CS-180 TaxID=3021720 RepID=UPI00232FDB0F|nr:hypothetical protein [Oscillatoria sp. CS-180]MDB9526158.1 hypothetical protein [Oscillatoria sp. CS-180]
MQTTEFIKTLSQQGIQLWADDRKLRIQAPKGTVTPEIKAAIAARKEDILALYRQDTPASTTTTTAPLPQAAQELGACTMGRLISGLGVNQTLAFQPPIVESQAMAQRLKVACPPLPAGYTKTAIVDFQADLKQRLARLGVQIVPWEEATKDFTYDIQLPLINRPWQIKTRIVRSDINAVIDVERQPNWIGKAKVCVAETLYQTYAKFALKGQKMSVTRIAGLIGWAEENLQNLEDPTNTQLIVLSDLDETFVSAETSYQDKIDIGIGKLIKTFSEIVVGVSKDRISILNMNLSDSVYTRDQIQNFILKSLVPKIYVPIFPLSLSRFKVSEYNPTASIYAQQLVKLGQTLDNTGLFPNGFKLDKVLKRQSHRDIVSWMAKGRTGVSYGFVAYAEPPQYIGDVEISAEVWQTLTPVAGFDPQELRQNTLGRRYVPVQTSAGLTFRQVPDVWVVSSRSGAKKTQLDLATDVLRVGLTDQLCLQMPTGVNPSTADIKPSYDVYVMVGIALATALYLPDLIQNGLPMVHFHGYPALDWFQHGEGVSGVENPSVPCGTYESGIFNFLSIRRLAQQHSEGLSLVGLIEPDHGTNIIAADVDRLIDRLKAGCDRGQVELGGRHFAALKGAIAPPSSATSPNRQTSLV